MVMVSQNGLSSCGALMANAPPPASGPNPVYDAVLTRVPGPYGPGTGPSFEMAIPMPSSSSPSSPLRAKAGSSAWCWAWVGWLRELRVDRGMLLKEGGVLG